MKVSILSNINTDWLVQDLGQDHLVYQPVGEGNWAGDLIDAGSPMHEFSPQAVFVILDGHELVRGCQSRPEVAAALDEALDCIEGFVRRNSSPPCFVANLDLPHHAISSLNALRIERFAETRWWAALDQLCQQFESCYLFELKELIEREGRGKFYSPKLMYAGHIPYSIRGHQLIAERIRQCVRAVAGQRRKLLVVDLDNTLWGGVLGEMGTDGIDLGDRDAGACYQDFQRRLKELKATGAVLAIASKNSASNVQDVFDRHIHMVLSRDDFVAKRIDWNLKPDNIRDLVADLNISMDAVLFLDDSPLERQFAKEQLPDLVVPEFPQDAAQLSDWLRKIYFEHFLALDITTEDAQKTELYQGNLYRDSLRRGVKTYQEFLKSLDTVVTVRHAEPADARRVAQLTQKTNQFNLTTRRYSEAEILDRIDDENSWVMVGEVEDRFGPSGQVSVVIVSRDGHTANLDTFLLSCRVMSRFIEDSILTAVEDFLVSQEVTAIEASYLPTPKNEPVQKVLERLGYTVTSESPDGSKSYQYVISPTRPAQRRLVAELVSKLED